MSIVTSTSVPAEVFPAVSVCVVVKVAVTPSANAGDILHDQFPLASTTSLHVCPFPSVTFTTDHISPVHVNDGVVSLVDVPSVGDVTTGAPGARVSILISDVDTSVVAFHAPSVMIASTLNVPSHSSFPVGIANVHVVPLIVSSGSV